jgi:hypothetical protein
MPSAESRFARAVLTGPNPLILLGFRALPGHRPQQRCNVSACRKHRPETTLYPYVNIIRVGAVTVYPTDAVGGNPLTAFDEHYKAPFGEGVRLTLPLGGDTKTLEHAMPQSCQVPSLHGNVTAKVVTKGKQADTCGLVTAR